MVVALLFLTLLWAVWARAVHQAWRGKATDWIGPYGLFASVTRREDRIRAGPATFVSFSLLCLVGWVLVLVGPADDASAPEIAGFLMVAALWLVSFVGIVTVVLFNRPKFLVPPHLRRQWGLLKVRRARLRRERSAAQRPPA